MLPYHMGGAIWQTVKIINKYKLSDKIVIRLNKNNNYQHMLPANINIKDYSIFYMFNNINFKANLVGYNIETIIDGNIIRTKIKSKNAKIKYGTQKGSHFIQLDSSLFSVCYCNTGLIEIDHEYNIPSFPNFTIKVKIDGQEHEIRGRLYHYTYNFYNFIAIDPIIVHGVETCNIVFEGKTQSNYVDPSSTIFDYMYADKSEIQNEYIKSFDITLFLIKKESV